MKNKYIQYINEVTSICHNNLKSGKNIFITGRNMSGKSDVIKTLIKNSFTNDLKSKLYFIDTTNRNLDLNTSENMIIDWNTEIYNLEKILSRRIFETNFNTVDCFAGDINNGAKIAYELFKDMFGFENFRRRLETFFENLPVQIKLIEGKIKFIFHNCEVFPSSGYQALLRIFTEIFFAYHMLDVRIFVIDEIDAHLDNVMCKEVIRKLKEVFADITICSTIHSINFFEESFDDDIVVLNGETYTYKVVNSSELGGLDSINRILFNSELENNLDENLRKQIKSNLKRNVYLSKEERVYIKRIKEKERKNLEDREFLDSLKEYKNYITFEELRNKFLANEKFTELEKNFIKINDITLDEERIKKILIKFNPYLGD